MNKALKFLEKGSLFELEQQQLNKHRRVGVNKWMNEMIWNETPGLQLKSFFHCWTNKE